MSFSMDWLDLLAVQGSLKSLLQHHSSKASILWPLGDLPDSGIKFASLTSPALAGRFFTTSTTWEAQSGRRLLGLFSQPSLGMKSTSGRGYRGPGLPKQSSPEKSHEECPPRTDLAPGPAAAKEGKEGRKGRGEGGHLHHQPGDDPCHHGGGRAGAARQRGAARLRCRD